MAWLSRIQHESLLDDKGAFNPKNKLSALELNSIIYSCPAVRQLLISDILNVLLACFRGHSEPDNNNPFIRKRIEYWGLIARN